MTLPARPHGKPEVVRVFGDPLPFVNDKFAWEQQSLISVMLPAPLIYAFDRTRFVTRVRAHRIVAQHLVDTLMACLDAGVRREQLEYGGCYAWRPVRGARKLSTHTWGIAVDLEPAENELGEVWATDDERRLSPIVIETFEARGWFWGGRFAGRPDPMHFQYCTGY